MKAAAYRERLRERMDRQQDSEESDEELRLFNIIHHLVHASETTARTTRPRESHKKDSPTSVFGPVFVPGRTATSLLQYVQEGLAASLRIDTCLSEETCGTLKISLKARFQCRINSN